MIRLRVAYFHTLWGLNSKLPKTQLRDDRTVHSCSICNFILLEKHLWYTLHTQTQSGACSSQGRLNQWAQWARAQGPGFFFLFEGPLTGCGEINSLKLIILLLMLLHDRTNTSSAYLVYLQITVQ